MEVNPFRILLVIHRQVSIGVSNCFRKYHIQKKTKYDTESMNIFAEKCVLLLLFRKTTIVYVF